MKKLLIAALCLLTVVSCTQHKKHYKQNVRGYKTYSRGTDGTDLLLYYYIFSAGNNSYYYTSSPTPINDFSTSSWSTSQTNPVSNIADDKIEPVETQAVPTENFNEDLQGQMESNPENFGGMTADEMGDYEGGSEQSNSSSESSDSGSDSGGDSGGGDSGGGDSGGGGGE